MSRSRLLTASLLCCVSWAAARAQTPLGTLKTDGAEVSGLVTVSNGHATIGNSAAVTAGSLPTDIALKRGGSVMVCAGSAVHLSQTTIAVSKPPLLLALDRGAVEIKMSAEKTDSILTPDLRFELSGAAALDLRIRVVPSGDTCVENVGKDAPVLHVTATFGDGAYFVRPGQRVLFEHGSLREVVDHETSSCGCPKGSELVLAGKGKRGDGKITEAARANPFPEAVSQGLQAPEIPQAPAGDVHAQVASTLSYSGPTNTVTGPPGQVTSAGNATPPSGPDTATGTNPAPTAITPARVEAPATAATSSAPVATDIHIESTAPPPAGPNPFRAIGRFFRHLFGGH